MRILIRADGGSDIGGGHITRCLSLVDAIHLANPSSEIHFVCCDLAREFQECIERRNIKLHLLPVSQTVYHNSANWQSDVEATTNIICEIGMVDWLVVDHYKIDKKWESQIFSRVNNLFVIDDLADRDHHCSLLLDQTYGITFKRYENRVTSFCKVLVGAKYALLGQDYSFEKSILNIRKNKKSINSAFVSLGASDAENYSDLVTDQIISVEEISRIYLVIGAANPNRDTLMKKYSKHQKVVLLYSLTPKEMIHYMMSSDVAVGAGGTSAWERCSCGLPGLIIVMVDNQREIANQLDSSGAMILSDAKKVTQSLRQLILTLNYDMQSYMSMVSSCLNICDGKGAARVAKKLMEYGQNK